MTGAFIRIHRAGRWQSVEIDQLTDAELEAIAEQQPDGGWRWAKYLAAWIRDNVQYTPDDA
jgi:hypothetical protein